MANILQFARLRKQPNPRKVPTGTSYTASGIAPRPQLDREDGSANTSPIREVVPELISPFLRQQTYARMMTDAAVDVSVRAWKTPVLGSEFFVDPYSADPLDQEISEFIWDNLSGGMTQPLLNSLEDILRMCEDGYSVLEKVYEEREWTPRTQNDPTGKVNQQYRNTKNYVMLKKLAPRATSTIKEIVYDKNGGPKQVIQTAIDDKGDTKDVTIDISRVIIFTLNRRGGDLTGKSMLRTAYQHWYYKNHMYKIDAIQKERHGIGVPRGKLLPGYNTSDKTILRNLLRNLRANEESFILQTPNVEIDFAELSGQPVDVLKSAEHHNGMILLNVMAQFLSLGVGVAGSGSGSRATGGVQSDTYIKSLKFIANYICEQINMYVIPELVVWNYPTKNFPQLKVRNIGETRDLQMLASGLANLFAQEVVTPDPATENWVRKAFDMPMKPAGSTQGPAQATTPATTNGNGHSATTLTPDVLAAAKGNVQPQNPARGQGNVGKPPNSAT